MYLPHTWGCEANLEEYYTTLKDIDKNMQDVKQKYQICGIIAGMDAQVEVKPRQETVCWKTARDCPVQAPRDIMKWKSKFERLAHGVDHEV